MRTLDRRFRSLADYRDVAARRHPAIGGRFARALVTM
jgi:hypothetical protein